MFKSKPEKRFFTAAAKGDLAALSTCLKEEAGKGDYSVDVLNNESATALMLAAEAGHTALVKELVRNGANMEIATAKRSTALLSAVEKTRTETVKLLLAAGANANTHNDDFCGPLHWASHNGDVESVRALIAAKADLNMSVASNLYTPLHYALAANRIPVAEVLINAGARTDLKNKDGVTALDMAKKSSPALAKLIETGRSKGPVAAVAAAAPEDGDIWTMLGPAKIAHIGVYPQIGRKLTEIFNFESRERLVLSENLSTGAESIGAGEKFDALSPDAVAAAAEALKQRGGNPERPLKVAFSL